MTDPTSGENVPVVTVGTDSSGNFSDEWGNVLSTTTTLKPGLTVRAVQGTTDVSVTVKKDTGVLGWILEKLLANAVPLRTDFTTTELADAGFSGTIALVGVSPNAMAGVGALLVLLRQNS